MTGSNSLHICEAQLIDIVQQWVNKEFKTKPEVVSVHESKDITSMFTVKLQGNVNKLPLPEQTENRKINPKLFGH